MRSDPVDDDSDQSLCFSRVYTKHPITHNRIPMMYRGRLPRYLGAYASMIIRSVCSLQFAVCLNGEAEEKLQTRYQVGTYGLQGWGLGMEKRQRYLVRLRPPWYSGTWIYLWIDTSNGEETVKIQSTSYLTPVEYR